MATTLARELAEEIFYEYQQDAVVGDKVRVTRGGKTFYRARPGKGKSKKAGIGSKGRKGRMSGKDKALAIAGGLAAAGAATAGGVYALNPTVRKKVNRGVKKAGVKAKRFNRNVQAAGKDLGNAAKSTFSEGKKGVTEAFEKSKEYAKEKPTGEKAKTAVTNIGEGLANTGENISHTVRAGVDRAKSHFASKKKKPKAAATGDSLEALNTAIAHIEDYKAGHPNYYIPKDYAYSR